GRRSPAAVREFYMLGFAVWFASRARKFRHWTAPEGLALGPARRSVPIARTPRGRISIRSVDLDAEDPTVTEVASWRSWGIVPDRPRFSEFWGREALLMAIDLARGRRPLRDMEGVSAIGHLRRPP